MTHSRLAQLIASQEGFYAKGKPNRPQKDHNPGDLRHAPHATGFDDAAIAIEPTDDAGWMDLERQISLDSARGLSLRQFIYKFAPPSENHTDSYLDFIVKGLGNPNPDTLLKLLADRPVTG